RPVLFLIARRGEPLFASVRPVPAEAVQATPAAPQRGTGGADAMTDAEVRAFVDRLDAASHRKDAEEILKYFAPEAIVEVTFISPLGPQSLRLTRDEFSQSLTQETAFRGLAEVLESQRVRFQITVSADGQQATVVEETRETIKVMGLTMPSRTE